VKLSAVRADQGVYLAAFAGANLDLDVNELLSWSHPGPERCGRATRDLFFLAIVGAHHASQKNRRTAIAEHHPTRARG
jgi:hypothetical protein